MVDAGSQVSWLKEFNWIEVTNINASIIRVGALWAVFLDVKPKETYVHIVDLFEGEHG